MNLHFPGSISRVTIPLTVTYVFSIYSVISNASNGFMIDMSVQKYFCEFFTPTEVVIATWSYNKVLTDKACS